MKTLRTLKTETFELAVLIEEVEPGKAQIDYFINGNQLVDWSKIKPIFQNLFTVLADDECKRLNLLKWSY